MAKDKGDIEQKTKDKYEKQESEREKDAHYAASEREHKDSVFIHDSIFITVGSDTIREIRYRTIYRYRWRTRVDTLFIERDKTTKSIAAEVKQNKMASVVEKRYVPPWGLDTGSNKRGHSDNYNGVRWLVLYARKRFGF